MRVDIEEIHKAKAVLSRINKVEITDIEFFKGGKRLELSPELLEEWRFIGLNNTDIITTDFYLGSGVIRETGIRDLQGEMIMEGDMVRYPHLSEEVLTVVFIGDGDGMDWAADKSDGQPDSWLDPSCEIINKGASEGYRDRH